MTDLPISHLQSVNSAGKIAPAFARLTAVFRSACGAVAHATAPGLR